MGGSRHEPTPIRVGGHKLQPFDGTEVVETPFYCAMSLNDLAQYSRTNPGLSFVRRLTSSLGSCRDLAQVTSKQPTVFFGAFLDTWGAGLTYQGIGAALGQSHDNLN